MENQTYKNILLPIIVKDFDLVNPNTNVLEIGKIIKTETSEVYDDIKNFYGLFDGLFYLN